MSDSAAVELSRARDLERTPGASLECEPLAARIRCLPGGAFRDAAQIGVHGRFLHIEVQGAPLAPGTLLEIESGTMLYLGEVERQNGSVYSVVVEHFVDRAKLRVIREIWT